MVGMDLHDFPEDRGKVKPNRPLQALFLNVGLLDVKHQGLGASRAADVQ
jgi:hypothetical protein